MKTFLATVLTVSLLTIPAMAETKTPADQVANGNYVLPMQPDYNASVWGENETFANTDMDDASALNEIAPAAGGNDKPASGDMKTMMEDFDTQGAPSETGVIEGDVNAAPYLKAF